MDRFSTFITRDAQMIEVEMAYCRGSEPTFDSPGSDAIADVVEARDINTDELVELTDKEARQLERNATELYEEYQCDHYAHYDSPALLT